MTRMKLSMIIDLMPKRNMVIKPRMLAKPSFTPGIGMGNDGSIMCIKMLIANNIVIKVKRRVGLCRFIGSHYPLRWDLPRCFESSQRYDWVDTQSAHWRIGPSLESNRDDTGMFLFQLVHDHFRPR